MTLDRKGLTKPDDVRSFPNGKLELFLVGGTTVGRAVYEPGWRWSADVKPIVKTDTCQVHHEGVTLSGRLHVVVGDAEIEIGPNDLFDIPPGHDAWVVGDEPWVAIDFFGR